MEGYRRLFDHCDPDRQKVIVDVTPDYMYQKTPLRVLLTITPVPKIVFILRNPAMRTYSLYQFARNNIGLIDKNMSFKTFIENIEASATRNEENRFILYDECEKSKYINYLKAYLDVFGSDQIIICLFEKLKRNPQQFMAELCRHINIDGGYYETYRFKKYNRRYTVRNQTLHRLRRKLRHTIPSDAISNLLSHLYNWINVSYTVNGLTGEEVEVIHKLNEEFRPFNRELASTFHVDLELWQ